MFETDDDEEEGGRYADVLVGMPELPAAACAPSGAVAFELDHETAFPQLLSAAQLVDGIVGYEKIAAWAVARQQELIAAFHARPGDGTVRPAVDVPDPSTVFFPTPEPPRR